MIKFRFKNDWLRRVPLVGALMDARWKDHREAIAEIGPGLVLSTTPIWLGALWLRVSLGPPESYLGLIVKNVDSGEFCLYAAATLGPLYYLIHKDYSPPKKFPSAQSFNLVGLVIAVTSSFLFAAQRAPEPDRQFVFDLSLALYLLALALIYLAHVYKNFAETGAAHRARTDTDDIVKELDEWSGGQ